MKQLLLLYAQYNEWANKRIIDAMLALEAGSADKEITSSFPTIRATVYHTWSAEHIWLQRLQRAERPVWMEAEFKGSFEDACALWQNTSAELISFVENQSGDKAFEDMCHYTNRQGTSHSSTVYSVLQHIINHSTYHRGQLVTMLRQAGATEIPGTDLILYTWNRVEA